jgi:hypothetical protein
MVFGLCYIGITVPYRLAFESYATGFWLTVNILIELMLVADILIQIRTAFYDQAIDGINKDPRAIAERYLKVPAYSPCSLSFSRPFPRPHSFGLGAVLGDCGRAVGDAV